MNNIIIPPASASPEEHAAFLLELARLHPNIAEALSSISGSRFDVARRAEVLTDAIETLHAGPDWKQGARWALEKITQQ